MTSILVTGAAGAIGTALCETLSAAGHDVVGLDRREPRWDPGVPVEQVDLTADPTLPETDVVVHLAAHSRVPPVVEDPSKAFETVAMTEPVLEHARRTDARVVFASSREVYGNAVGPAESEAGLDAVNPYGASKVACESLCNSYHNCYDLPVTTLRLSNVYGRYDANARVVPIFVALATAGEELPVYGAEKVLDFVHVEDATAAFAAAIDRGHEVAGETFNVGSGSGTSLTDLADRIAGLVEACPGYRVEADRAGEVEHYVADVSSARDVLEWEPTVSLDDGLERTVAWYRNHDGVPEEIRAAR